MHVMATTSPEEHRKRIGLGTRILIGMIVGAGLGVVLGEGVGLVESVGDSDVMRVLDAIAAWNTARVSPLSS